MIQTRQAVSAASPPQSSDPQISSSVKSARQTVQITKPAKGSRSHHHQIRLRMVELTSLD